MAKNNKINLPSGSAGLTRYYSEYKSKFSFPPGVVVVLIIVVIVVIIGLHIFGAGMFGL